MLSAENDFLISKKSFKNAIGYEPVDLKEVDNLTLNLPKSLEESIIYLQKDNMIIVNKMTSIQYIHIDGF